MLNFCWNLIDDYNFDLWLSVFLDLRWVLFGSLIRYVRSIACISIGFSDQPEQLIDALYIITKLSKTLTFGYQIHWLVLVQCWLWFQITISNIFLNCDFDFKSFVGHRFWFWFQWFQIVFKWFQRFCIFWKSKSFTQLLVYVLLFSLHSFAAVIRVLVRYNTSLASSAAVERFSSTTADCHTSQKSTQWHFFWETANVEDADATVFRNNFMILIFKII